MYRGGTPEFLLFFGELKKQAGAELCQAQRCLVGYEIRFEQNYFYQNEFY